MFYSDEDGLLDKLIEHDSDKDYANLESNVRFRIMHIRYKKTSTILRDFILIFVACAITRYDPALWRNKYSGEDSKLIFYFEKSFNNIYDMVRLVNDIITQAEEGTLLKNYNLSKKMVKIFIRITARIYINIIYF